LVFFQPQKTAVFLVVLPEIHKFFSETSLRVVTLMFVYALSAPFCHIWEPATLEHYQNKWGVEKPTRAGYREAMTASDSLQEDPNREQDETEVTESKPRSAKRFLMFTATRFSFGLGILGLVGLAAWLSRNTLATMTIESFLRSKGVPADITIEKLQLGTAQIRNLRLGDAEKPNLFAEKTIITWRIDSKARLFIIDRLDVDGVTLRLGIDNTGKIDFGALAPLLTPSDGPKRSVVNGVTLSHAQVFLETPLGQAQANLKIWGGERDGWTGWSTITPPASLQLTDGGTSPFRPLPVGFAVRQRGADRIIGFSGRPTGQSFTYDGLSARGLIGDLTGQAILFEDKSLRIDTRPLNLRATELKGKGVAVAGLALQTNPVFWSHNGPWQTTGWGNFVANGSVERLKLARTDALPTGLSVGASQFRLGAARGQSGRMQLDYSLDAQAISGPLSGQRLRTSGNVATALVDMTQIATADLAGRSDVNASNIVIPKRLLGTGAANLPPQIGAIAASRLSGQGSFDFTYGQKGGQIRLAGPLRLSSASGARAVWTPRGRPAPSIVLANKPNGTSTLNAFGSGQLSTTLPGLGALDATIEGATYGPAGWAFVGRNIEARGFEAVARQFGVAASARLDRLNLTSGANGALSGQGRGQVSIIGAAGSPRAGRALLTFDGRATANAVSGTLSGPLEGFGTLLGLGGYGMRGGSLNLVGDASRRGSDWQMAARGRIAGAAFASQPLNLTAPNLNFDAAGRLSRSGGLSGRAQIAGRAAAASPGQTVRLGLGNIALDGQASFGGSLKAVTSTGSLTARVGRGEAAGFGINDAQTNLTYSGRFGPSGYDLRGTTITNLAQFQTDNRAGSISITNARAGGPFQLAGGDLASRAPFWDGRLQNRGAGHPIALRTDLDVVLGNLRTPDLQISQSRVTLPLRAALSSMGDWSATGRATGQIADLRAQTTTLSRMDVDTPFDVRASGNTISTSGTLKSRVSRAALDQTRLADLFVEGPFDGRIGDSGWRGGGNFNVRASSLTSGDTRLTGLVAQAPVRASSTADGISVTSSSCVTYRAGSGQFPGEASVGPVSGSLCPNSAGQLALLGGRTPRLYATTAFDPLTIQIGGPQGDQRIELGEINGTLGFKPNGGLALNFLASQFGFSLKLPDGTTATINAREAALDVTPVNGTVRLKGRIGRVSSIGLPVLISGGADADLLAGARGVSGSFGFDDVRVKDADKAQRFGEFRLVGAGNLSGNRITVAGDVQDPISNIKLADLVVDHNIASGGGRLALDATDLLMSPAPIDGRPGLDIADLIPPLRGVLTDMKGVINATTDIAWERNQPLVSGARIETKALDFGTLLGPVTALSGEVTLDDLLLVRSAGTQKLKIGSLNTGGIPVLDGTVLFALPGDNTLRLDDASWPFAEGKLSVRPATWAFRDGDQSFAIDVEDVDLAKLLRLTDVPNLEIDGKVSGVFPIEVRNGNVEIVGGRLRAREGGGMIRYTGPGAAPPPPPKGFWGRTRERIFGKPAPKGADLAIEALRALEYKILEITVNGRLSGELLMGVILEGANQQVLSGQPFKFNIKMNLPVGQLLDSLNSLPQAGQSAEVLAEIDRVLREDAAERARTMPSTPPPQPPPPPKP
jgi:hypothetical protein